VRSGAEATPDWLNIAQSDFWMLASPALRQDSRLLAYGFAAETKPPQRMLIWLQPGRASGFWVWRIAVQWSRLRSWLRAVSQLEGQRREW